MFIYYYVLRVLRRTTGRSSGPSSGFTGSFSGPIRRLFPAPRSRSKQASSCRFHHYSTEYVLMLLSNPLSTGRRRKRKEDTSYLHEWRVSNMVETVEGTEEGLGRCHRCDRCRDDLQGMFLPSGRYGVQCTTQCSAVQCSAVQCSAVQCSTMLRRM